MTGIVLTQGVATTLEEQFLSGLEDAQAAYSKIVELRAWTALGFDTFGEWWDSRVQPVMTALSMRPTREIAASVVEQVRAEEAALPPAQRRTQSELAAMAGISTKTLQRQDRAQETLSAGADLEGQSTFVGQNPTQMPAGQETADEALAAIDKHFARVAVEKALDEFLPPDPDAPHREWRLNFLAAMTPTFRLLAGFTVDQVAEHADEECLDELERLARQITSYRDRVRAACPIPNNVRHLRAV